MPGEEVTFYSGGCAIAGTFTEAADPVAAALLGPGGGKSDRNSDARLPGGRMLRIGADKAIAGARAGARVCALRYDKRGVGASGGEYLRAGMDNRRAGARAALGWLTARAGGLPLLAIGHSEGAWYAAELAADHAVAGAVLLTGGAARRGDPVLADRDGRRPAAPYSQDDPEDHPHRHHPHPAQAGGPHFCIHR